MSKINLVKLTIQKIESEYESIKITSSEDAYKLIRQFYDDDVHIYESMFALFLDASNHVKNYVKISQGGVQGTVVDTRIIAKYAVDCLASGVILAHNHPSGNLTPSDADIRITKKVKDGLNTLDIKLLDHLIITDKRYRSFNDDGLIN